MSNKDRSAWFKITVLLTVVTFILPITGLEWMVTLALSQQPDELRVGIGDAIRIMVWDGRQIPKEGSYLSKFNRDFIVDGRGYINLTVLGEVKIDGSNAEEIQKVLTEKFRMFAKEPIVMVKPLIRVTLYGAFHRPGTYRVPPDMTFWQLVDETGGPASDCDFQGIHVERKGEIVIENFLAAFEQAYSLRDVGIQSGDQIFAPSKGKLTFKDMVTYVNFGTSLIMMYLTFQNYRARRR